MGITRAERNAGMPDVGALRNCSRSKCSRMARLAQMVQDSILRAPMVTVDTLEAR